MTGGRFPTTPSLVEGVLAVVSGVSDLVLVHNAPDCLFELAENVAVRHDLCSTLLDGTGRHRVSSTYLLDRDLVFGAEGALQETALSVIERRRPAMLMVSQSSMPVLAGLDAAAIAEEIERQTGVPVALVAGDPLDGCWVDGVARATEAIARRLDLEPGRSRSGVAVIGHPMSRLEADHVANVAELSRMLQALNLPPRSIWFSGEDVAKLACVGEAEHLIGLPYAGEATRILGARLSAEVTSVELPIGLDGTVRWLREVGASTGREERAESFIDRELRRAVPRLEWAIPRGLQHRRVAVVGDQFMVRALVPYLQELGMKVPSVAIHSMDRDMAGLALLREDGSRVPVISDPSFPGLEEEWRRLRASGELDIVMGTSYERGAAKDLGVPYLEIGYPSAVRHAIFDAPLLGFSGALWLADALFNLLADAEY